MMNESRANIYKFIEDMLINDVTQNVYLVNEPQELTQSDVTNGFIVVRVGDLNDASEFDCQAYGWARVFIEAYIPPKSRGRLNTQIYESFESGINMVIKKSQKEQRDAMYWIRNDSILSTDAIDYATANNTFFVFVKSFVVMIDEDLYS